MKYCPHRACPHRQRVGAPAEFLDHVSSCSDCKTPLVDSEREAIEGIAPPSGDPYRGPAGRTTAAVVRRHRPGGNDVAIGAALLLVGLWFTGLTYMNGSSHGTYIVALGPMIYGAIRLLRGLRERAAG
ncbi:uncharacterized protein SOCE26_019500 [Sorangium cellulosum]|uniref:Uncharacterized protein n=1 Tax=Sorangium cellulosum TaxID=56 RepID=A0A2L0EMN2_SORCE|nr:hypothetical protein [Sorangium cellulosum]AUX40549.1 uncharacterized protein SOCE26_019500 [Sorangium cellulosum]